MGGWLKVPWLIKQLQNVDGKLYTVLEQLFSDGQDSIEKNMKEINVSVKTKTNYFTCEK